MRPKLRREVRLAPRAGCQSWGEWVVNFAKRNPPLGAQAPKFREVRPAPVQAAACLDGAAVVFIFLGVAGVLAVVVDVVFLGVDVVEVLRRHAENLRK